MNFNNFTRIKFISKLNQNSIFPNNHYLQKKFADKPARDAAVLIPLIFHRQEWQILFIKRAIIKGDIHSGQVSLPGGSTEDIDSNLTDTALRETHEEIGISRQNINVVGKMNSYITVSNFEVTPIIGIVKWPIQLNLSKNEVDKTFLIPLNWLADSKNFQFKKRAVSFLKSHKVIYFNKYDSELLWGATAKFILDFISILK